MKEALRDDLYPGDQILHCVLVISLSSLSRRRFYWKAGLMSRRSVSLEAAQKERNTPMIGIVDHYGAQSMSGTGALVCGAVAPDAASQQHAFACSHPPPPVTIKVDEGSTFGVAKWEDTMRLF